MRISQFPLSVAVFFGLLFLSADLEAQPYLKYFYDDAGNRSDKLFTLQKHGSAASDAVRIYHDKLGEVVVKIYPNPATERVTLEFSEAVNVTGSLRVTDVSGKVLYQNDAPDQKLEIDVVGFTAGSYYLQLTHNDVVSNWLFIKQ